MNYQAMYAEKRKTPEEAVSIVRDGDWVDYGQTCSYPQLLDRALSARSGELKDVKIRSSISMVPIATVENDPGHSFTYNLWHCSGIDRKYLDQGRAFHSPMLFRQYGSYYRKGYAPVNVAMITVSPMDRNGNFSYGLSNAATQEIVDAAERVIVEVNPTMPTITGIENDHINIRDVSCLVESDLPVPTVKSGCTLQLGIGGIPNSIGSMIAESDVKDLGMHTELLSDGYLDLCRAGRITNSKKKVHRGKGIFSVCNGSRELYDYLDHNESILSAPMRYVNDPQVIRELDDFVSINGCIAVDLFAVLPSICSGRSAASLSACARSAGPADRWTLLPAQWRPSTAGPSLPCTRPSPTGKGKSIRTSCRTSAKATSSPRPVLRRPLS